MDMVKKLNPDVPRLEKVLDEIHKHGGQTTLGQDWSWLQRVQHEKPGWAKPVFERYAKVTHCLNDIIKKPSR